MEEHIPAHTTQTGVFEEAYSQTQTGSPTGLVSCSASISADVDEWHRLQDRRPFSFITE